MFGGFILHFLLSNYLTVLLRPSYEKPVDTTKDMIERGITPFHNSEVFRQMMAASPNPNMQELARRLITSKNSTFKNNAASIKAVVAAKLEWNRKIQSTGKYALLSTFPMYIRIPEDFKYWYRSSETLQFFRPYAVALANKKWPLKKVD